MSPARTGPLAYWHSGGAIEGRAGPLSRDAAFRLLQLHAAERMAAIERQDPVAVDYCAAAWREIAAAIAAADAWRAAATAPSSSCVR